jgi:hypothetical protein
MPTLIGGLSCASAGVPLKGPAQTTAKNAATPKDQAKPGSLTFFFITSSLKAPRKKIRGAQGSAGSARFLKPQEFLIFDKNSLWGGLNIQKRELCVKGNCAQRDKILGLFWAVSAGIRGIFGVEVGRGCLQRFDEDRQAFWRLIRTHRFLPPRIPDLYDCR